MIDLEKLARLIRRQADAHGHEVSDGFVANVVQGVAGLVVYEQEGLDEALKAATELANNAEGMGCGHVSGLGCDIAFYLERIQAPK